MPEARTLERLPASDTARVSKNQMSVRSPFGTGDARAAEPTPAEPRLSLHVEEPARLEYVAAGPTHTDQVLELFAAAFRVKRTPQRWAWQYEESPAGPGLVTVALDGDAVVGCLGLMRQDLWSAGERIPAGQVCDAAVAEEYRGAGKFGEMVSTNQLDAAIRGFQVAFGFPNELSFPAMLKHAAHRRVLVMRRYSRLLGARGRGTAILEYLLRPLLRTPHAIALRIRRWRDRTPTRLEVHSRLPEGIGPLLAAYRESLVLAVYKDEEYLRWRYEQHPEHSYHFHLLVRDGAPAALGVVRPVADVAAICELIVPQTDPVAGVRLLREIMAHYAARPQFHLVEFLAHDVAYYDAVCERAGLRRDAHSQFRMTFRAFTTGLLPQLAIVADNWTIVHGDTDVI